MSTIEGVPESITREQYLTLIRSVGLDPTNVKSLAFEADGIQAVIFATDERGFRIVNVSGGGYAKHSIFIRVDKPAINLSGAVA